MSESLKMLESDEGQMNSVFAIFGSAVQNAQFFEAALGNFLLVSNKFRKREMTLQDFEIFDQKLQKKTMGTLLKDLLNMVSVKDERVTDCFETALRDRNFLMHHFFRERTEEDFGNELGRMEMIAELNEIDSNLQQATIIMNAMRLALIETLTEITIPLPEEIAKTIT